MKVANALWDTMLKVEIQILVQKGYFVDMRCKLTDIHWSAGSNIKL